MAREIKARTIQIAILAIPAESAQTVTDQLVPPGSSRCSTSPRRGSV
jgi:NADH/NAD ratio-sensing transcriptional regulator Rex